MKAVICTRYGAPNVLKIREVPKPTPKADEVLIKIRATSVASSDTELRSFTYPALIWLPLRLASGVFAPRVKILGQEIAGDIEAIGATVSNFKVGDAIFAFTSLRFGAYADYICLPQDALMVTKPAQMTYEQAAVIPTGALAALVFLKKAQIQRGQKVLIYAASGSIGTYAVQLAKHFGAHVTAVCTEASFDIVKSLGADVVSDYTQTHFSEFGETYDVIFDTIGKGDFGRGKRALTENGHYLLANFALGEVLAGLWMMRTSTRKVMFWGVSETVDDLLYLKNLTESGELRAVIDRTYPLDQIVDAHTYVDSKRKIGNVAITVA